MTLYGYLFLTIFLALALVSIQAETSPIPTNDLVSTHPFSPALAADPKVIRATSVSYRQNEILSSKSVLTTFSASGDISSKDLLPAKWEIKTSSDATIAAEIQKGRLILLDITTGKELENFTVNTWDSTFLTSALPLASIRVLLSITMKTSDVNHQCRAADNLSIVMSSVEADRAFQLDYLGIACFHVPSSAATKFDSDSDNFQVAVFPAPYQRPFNTAAVKAHPFATSFYTEIDQVSPFTLSFPTPKWFRTRHIRDDTVQTVFFEIVGTAMFTQLKDGGKLPCSLNNIPAQVIFYNDASTLAVSLAQFAGNDALNFMDFIHLSCNPHQVAITTRPSISRIVPDIQDVIVITPYLQVDFDRIKAASPTHHLTVKVNTLNYQSPLTLPIISSSWTPKSFQKDVFDQAPASIHYLRSADPSLQNREAKVTCSFLLQHDAKEEFVSGSKRFPDQFRTIVPLFQPDRPQSQITYIENNSNFSLQSSKDGKPLYFAQGTGWIPLPSIPEFSPSLESFVRITTIATGVLLPDEDRSQVPSPCALHYTRRSQADSPDADQQAELGAGSTMIVPSMVKLTESYLQEKKVKWDMSVPSTKTLAIDLKSTLSFLVDSFDTVSLTLTGPTRFHSKTALPKFNVKCGASATYVTKDNCPSFSFKVSPHKITFKLSSPDNVRPTFVQIRSSDITYVKYNSDVHVLKTVKLYGSAQTRAKDEPQQTSLVAGMFLESAPPTFAPSTSDWVSVSHDFSSKTLPRSSEGLVVSSDGNDSEKPGFSLGSIILIILAVIVLGCGGILVFLKFFHKKNTSNNWSSHSSEAATLDGLSNNHGNTNSYVAPTH